MSILSSLMSPPTSAIVVPVEGESLSPGSPRWEAFFGGIRAPGIDVFGLYPIVGIMHERDARRSPHYVAAHGSMGERHAIEEGALRLRAWFYAQAPSYDQVVFLAGGPLTPIWSRAVAGTPAAHRVRVIPVRNGNATRGMGAAAVQGMPGLDGIITRTRLVNAIGRGT